jgi:Ca2+-binding RTX toxin-like protein
MRRLVLLLMGIAMVLVLASGVALAVNKIGTNGPDTLRGTNGADNLLGKGGNDAFFADNGPATRDIVSCGRGFDRVAADERDVVASDCEQVRRGPNAGEKLDAYLQRSGFLDKLFGGLAPFPGG